jgi:hypothetical protein
MRQHPKLRLGLIAFALLVSLAAPPALAQGERGAFNGIVTDMNGAAVPNAEVTALNTETNVETKVTTTEAGVYRLPYLPSGPYKISVRASGFKTAEVTNLTLLVAQTLTVDLKLEPGQLSDTVTVTSETPPLESSTAEIGRYVTKQEFDTWPVAVGDGQRQIQTFIFTSLPGAVGSTFQGSINGGQNYSHEILIEGMPLGRFDLQGGSNNEFSPSAESVSEFKLQTGTISAQYGGGQTSVANFAIKSGTNDFHGGAYTYVQNDALRANSFNNKALGRRADGSEVRPRPPYKLFNYGYNFNGPVWIPKVYNGKDRTFFFNSLEVTRVRDFVSIGFSTLPVPEFKQGNFSKLLSPAFTGDARSGTTIGTDALGRPVVFGQLYDPATTRTVNGVTVRDPFPGNIIPQNRWSQVSSNILSKAGITDPILGSMLNNYPNLNTCCPVFDQRIYAVKVDHKLSENHRLSSVYNHTYRLRNNSPGGRWGEPPGLPTGVYQLQYTPGRMVRITYDWTISPNLVNQVRLGYNRFGNLNESVFVDQDWPQQIGLQNVPGTHFPGLLFGGAAYQGGGIGAGGRLGSSSRGGSYNGSTILMDDMTYLRGSHNFKGGFELRKYYYNFRNKSGSGDFNFSPVQTELPGYSASTGHSFASFLLGAVSSASRAVAVANFGYRVTQPSFYFSDDWKVNQKLTLNLGVRWEMNFGYNEVAGRESMIDLTKPNPGAGNRPGALVFADELGRKGFHDNYLKMVSPRLGFAYAVSDKMVVRGGYGINANPFIANFSTPGAIGYNGSIAIDQNTNPTTFPQDPVYYLHQPFPSLVGTLPNRNPAQLNNQGYNYIAPDSNRVGYAQNYSLTVQYQLPASFVAEVGYIGNKGTRLEANGLDNLNQLPVSALRYGDDLFAQLSARPGLGIPLPYAGFNGTVAQALRPYPQFGNIGQIFANFGTSHYDSLQVQVTRHLTKGLAFLGAYTWSKAIFTGSDSAIDAAGSQDVYNRRLERSISSFHIPHFVKLTWIYELPFGKNRKWLNDGFLSHVIGGWTLTSIHNYRAGDPLSVSAPASIQRTILFNGVVRPDWIQGVPVVLNGDADVKTNGTGALYLNPAAFALVPRTGNNVPLRLGTAPPRLPNVRGPAVYSEDFGLEKKFAINESTNFEIRADFFNAFNRAGRGNPNTDITSPLFGRIVGARFGPRNIQFQARFNF